MRKRLNVVLCIILGVLLLGVCGLVIGQNLYYRNRWYPGTTINGISVAGYTLEESKGKLQEYFQDYTLTVTGRDNGNLTIAKDEIEYAIMPNSKWEEAFQAQHNRWLLPFTEIKSPEVGYDVSYNEQSLNSLVSQSVLVKGNGSYAIQKPVSAHAEYDAVSNQFVCVREIIGNTIRIPVLLAEIKSALQQGKMDLDLNDIENYPEVYERPQVTSQDPQMKNQINACNNAAMRFITWKFDKDLKETITPKRIAGWITYKNNKVTYNETAMEKWVEKFCKKYCTVGKTRKIKSHTGKKVVVAGGDYGWQISTEQTLKQLKKALKQKIDMKDTEEYMKEPSSGAKKALSISNKPAYLVTAHNLDFDGEIQDWDPENYVEVSLKEQMVYVFRKGKVAYSCRCISGRPVKDRTTKKGAYYIKEHRTNYTMVGEDYKTFVKYWVRITWTGTGFHPATWQPWSRWTKTLYKTKGSHGCLNLTAKDAEKLYYMLKYKEAVFIY
ncbi:MAG: peptidoglycan binding domain-containing protein [Lachnospiraceae bacterium]|nr:peptidoglycan binding domain-containing protein [Lachnospiraceae bacterium]